MYSETSQLETHTVRMNHWLMNMYLHVKCNKVR
jgi:hypothetical protein